MKDEAAFKKHFKASVRAQGGFSISLAAPMLPGTPDLFILMPGFMPVLLEAKFLKHTADTFKRKLEFTEMQKYVIRNCNKVQMGSAFGLVGVKHHNKYYAVIVASHTPYFERIDDQFLHSMDCHTVIIDNQKQLWDIKTLFSFCVPRMQYNYEPLLTKDWQPDSVEVSATTGDLVDTTSTLAI